MQFRDKQIAPPKEWGVFENLCHALFKKVWNDPLTQKNGRRGQAQHGVDVFNSSQGKVKPHWGVQCKGKDSNYGSKLEWSEVLSEITKAEKFSPKLDHWILATTAPTDAAIQKSAREISAERKTKGLFSVSVLGWEEIQALMASEPEIILEFYPEHADHLPQVIEALGALHTKVEHLTERLDKKLNEPLSLHGSAVWEAVKFDSNRGLGPALMGYSLGPSDAANCPRLTEVSIVSAQLKIAYSARLIGEPGSGKSICAYQIAKEFSNSGFEVLRLLDPQAINIKLDAVFPGIHRLYVLDDAHLMTPHILSRLEDQASPTCMIVSTHNADQSLNARGAITLDAKRAVKTIAAELRSDLAKTLEAVRLADNNVGERMMDNDLTERLDQAEESADRPWQFCFVLGGGWRRSIQAADSARAAQADLILAAVAMRQLISRDARAIPNEISEVCSHADIEVEAVHQGLNWLERQRLIICSNDCRTPHQRFAAVVLKSVLGGQDKLGREKIARMIEGVITDPQFSYAGLRVLVHELRFGSGNYNWNRLLGQAAIETAVSRCWAAEDSDRVFAALALADIWNFAEGGASAVVKPYVAVLAKWISNPGDEAYGFGHLLNGLVQQDKYIAEQVLSFIDPTAIALNFSNASPDTAYGMAELMRSVAYVGDKGFNAKVFSAIDCNKLRLLAKHPAFIEKAYSFSKLCASIIWWDENLALEMAEGFIPVAQEVLKNDPVEGFNEISFDLASTVLRVFDVLHVYVGKMKPTSRQHKIARQICKKIDPKLVAKQISAIRPRQFQSASYFLHFLFTVAPRKFEAVLRQIDWVQLDALIGDDWSNMPHDTEMLLSVLYSRKPTRYLVEKFIQERANRIVHFPPRLMLMVPEVGIEHLAKGGSLKLFEYGHVDWRFGGGALAVLAGARPDLVEQIVAPFTEEITRCLTTYNRSYTDSAENFVRIIVEHAPVAWHEVLAKLNLPVAETNLAKCLTMDEDHRRTAAVIIESALMRNDLVGDMARRLRKKYPKSSLAPMGSPRFKRMRRRSKSQNNPIQNQR